MSHNETIAEETMPINSCNYISAMEITIKIYGNGKNLLMLKQPYKCIVARCTKLQMGV